MCVCVCAHGYLQVDSAASYVTERGIAQNLAKWLTSPHTKLMRLSDQYSSHLKPSFLFLFFIFLHWEKKYTQTQRGHAHTQPSKSSLEPPMVLHDRLQAALMNTYTKPRQTRILAHTHTHTHTHTQDGAYLPSPVSVLHFSKALPLKAHRRREELIIPDISGAEQVSYNNKLPLSPLFAQ